MSVRDLFFRIGAKDDTASAFAAVRKNMQGVEGAARTLRDRINSAGKSMRNIGAGLSAAVTAPLALAARNMVGLYQIQEKAEAQVAQAIRQTGAAAGFSAEQLFKEASALQELSAVGDEKILADVTAQLLTFGNVSRDIFKRAQIAALDLSAVLGSDLKGQTIQLGKSLNDPVKGISALGKAGIQFSEQQKSVIKSLVETGRVAEAQGLILDEIAQFYGGQAATSAQTLTGQLTALGNAWGDLQEQFGAIIADFLPPIIAGLRGVIAALQEMPEPMRRFIVAGAAIAAAIGPVLGVLGLLALGLAALPAAFVAAAAGVAALAAGLVAFWPQITAAYEAVRDGVAQVLEAINGFAADVVASVSDMAAQVWRVITSGFDRVLGYVDKTVGKIAEAFDWLYIQVVGNSSVPDLVDGVLGEFDRLASGAIPSATDTAQTIAGVFDDLGAQVASTFDDMVRTGDFSLKTLGRSALSIGANVAGSFASAGISALASSAASALAGAASSFFSGGVTNAPAGFTPASASAFKLPQFNEGADFTVGGRGGIDRNLVQFMATQGERVTVTPRGDGARAPVVNVTISTPSPEAFHASRGQVAATLARAVGRGGRNT